MLNSFAHEVAKRYLIILMSMRLACMKCVISGVVFQGLATE